MYLGCLSGPGLFSTNIDWIHKGRQRGMKKWRHSFCWVEYSLRLSQVSVKYPHPKHSTPLTVFIPWYQATFTHGHHQLILKSSWLYFSNQRWISCILSAKTRPGADCSSDHQLLIAKFRLKLKKARKTTRPARYDLNQIPCEDAVEVKNRFKGWDLVDRVPEELWTEAHYIVQEAVNKTIPKKKKSKKVKW